MVLLKSAAILRHIFQLCKSWKQIKWENIWDATANARISVRNYLQNPCTSPASFPFTTFRRPSEGSFFRRNRLRRGTEGTFCRWNAPCSPTEGRNLPKSGFRRPSEGRISPENGFRSPTKGGNLPESPFRRPSEGILPPNSCFRSPTGRIGFAKSTAVQRLSRCAFQKNSSRMSPSDSSAFTHPP